MTMSIVWSTPSPCVRAAATKPAHTCFALAVSNQFQRRPTLQNDADHHNNSSKGVGALGRTVLTALESNSRSSKFNSRGGQCNSSINSSIQCSNSKQQKQEPESDERDILLSGSEVLRALQRATARKIKKKRRDYPSSNKVVRGRSGTEQEDEEDNWDYRSARPICIKTDWTTRLDELEKRLQELADTAT